MDTTKCIAALFDLLFHIIILQINELHKKLPFRQGFVYPSVEIIL